MRRIVKKSVEVTETKDVVVSESVRCNRCGEQYENVYCDSERFIGNWDAMIQSFKFAFGYGSKFDGEYWEFDLCEICLESIFKDFKYVPNGFRSDEYIQLDDERHQAVFDNWKVTGEWEDLKYHTYDELLEYEDLFNEDYFQKMIKKYHPDKV
ncbi:hypothetical protein NSQ20_12035 [Paenibacillus sp. FSL K6-1122]|uniref:hypothetical protein n=1 Tax=Paenibacillus sp. FSL K6-1122 TaxID=2954512 RepID=UPI0030EEA0CB